MKRFSYALVQVTVALTSLTIGCQHSTTSSSQSSGLTTNSLELFGIVKDGKWGFMNKHGEVVIAAQFDHLFDFTEGLSGVCIGPCKYVKDNPAEQFSLTQTFQGKYGFIDQNGKMTINPRFSIISGFHKSLAMASTRERTLIDKTGNLLLGYIDTKGTFVIPEQFLSAGDFDNLGYAGACVGTNDDRRCGFIDTSGKFIINPIYNSVGEYKDDLATVFETSKSTPSYIDRKGRVIWKGEHNKADD